MPFPHNFEGYRSSSAKVHESNIAILRMEIDKYLKNNELSTLTYKKGWWRRTANQSGITNLQSRYQDIIVAKKTANVWLSVKPY